jgi:hypothetical protein
MSFGVIMLLVVVGTTIWVGMDASQREWKKGQDGTTSWVIGCLLLWIIAFPWYLSKRGSAPRKGAHLVGPPRDLPVSAAMYRECLHCKEQMRRDAEVCPRCRLESPAWRLHEDRWWFRASPTASWQWLDESTGKWHVIGQPSAAAASPSSTA